MQDEVTVKMKKQDVFTSVCLTHDTRDKGRYLPAPKLRIVAGKVRHIKGLADISESAV